MQGKDKISKLVLDARMMVAGMLLDSRDYEEIRGELRQMYGVAAEAMPSDVSFRSYRETEEYRHIHRDAIAGQAIGVAAVGVDERMADLEKVTREAALRLIWRELQDESLEFEQRLKVLDRLRGLQSTELRADRQALDERRYQEGERGRSLDRLLKPGLLAMKAAGVVERLYREPNADADLLAAAKSTMRCGTNAVSIADHEYTAVYPGTSRWIGANNWGESEEQGEEQGLATTITKGHEKGGDVGGDVAVGEVRREQGNAGNVREMQGDFGGVAAKVARESEEQGLATRITKGHEKGGGVGGDVAVGEVRREQGNAGNVREMQDDFGGVAAKVAREGEGEGLATKITKGHEKGDGVGGDVAAGGEADVAVGGVRREQGNAGNVRGMQGDFGGVAGAWPVDERESGIWMEAACECVAARAAQRSPLTWNAGIWDVMLAEPPVFYAVDSLWHLPPFERSESLMRLHPDDTASQSAWLQLVDRYAVWQEHDRATKRTDTVADAVAVAVGG